MIKHHKSNIRCRLPTETLSTQSSPSGKFSGEINEGLFAYQNKATEREYLTHTYTATFSFFLICFSYFLVEAPSEKLPEDYSAIQEGNVYRKVCW